MVQSEDEKLISQQKPVSFVGFSNYPDQYRRKKSKLGTSLNILIVGESGLGKRTFINSLFNCDLLEVKKEVTLTNKFPNKVEIQAHQASNHYILTLFIV